MTDDPERRLAGARRSVRAGDRARSRGHDQANAEATTSDGRSPTPAAQDGRERSILARDDGVRLDRDGPGAADRCGAALLRPCRDLVVAPRREPPHGLADADHARDQGDRVRLGDDRSRPRPGVRPDDLPQMASPAGVPGKPLRHADRGRDRVRAAVPTTSVRRDDHRRLGWVRVAVRARRRSHGRPDRHGLFARRSPDAPAGTRSSRSPASSDSSWSRGCIWRSTDLPACCTG